MKKAWIFLLITAVINIAVRIIARVSPDFSEFYAANIYPIIAEIIARITGIFPFSVIEIILVLLVLGIIIGLVLLIINLVKRKEKRAKIVKSVSMGAACTISGVLVLLLFGCEINYQRQPFSYYSGLSLTGYSSEMLLAVIDEIIDELDIIVEDIELSEVGMFTMDEGKLTTVARESMTKLGKSYSCLDIYYPNAKPILLSRQFLSSTLICGVFSPFTIEANYNNDMPVSEKAFTICHELSHLNGFMREDEANFISFLACRESGDNDFYYSAYTRALTYSINAYYSSVSYDEYCNMYNRIPEQVQLELALINAYWRPFRHTIFSDAATAVNDTYLKANSQSDGTKSYGRFVDLLIADYLYRSSQ